MDPDDAVHKAERDHLTELWPDQAATHFAGWLDRRNRAYPEFDVRLTSKRPKDPWAVFVTLGAWTATAGSGTGVEFFLLAPTETQDLASMMAGIAKAHCEPGGQLGPGSFVAFGKPWLKGSNLTQFLVIAPDPVAPIIPALELPERRIEFLRVVPITEDEAELVREVGVAAFLERLIGVDTVATTRPSVAAS